MATAAELNSEIEAAITLRKAGDVAGALNLMRSAQMMLAGIPDTKSADVELRWGRESIAEIIADLQRENAGSTGIRRQKYEYRRTSAHSGGGDC